ncbi:hypothetical protein CUU95_12570 [Vreelandella alkaliphila]|uniref:glycosyltransferase family 2 protein n=1 Tax=Vreelandella alkaliphila TaxID=272774 RepID=UPI000EA13AE6|nr:glycosyltransferase family 2 protein [Halomonas alkaliphila]AYF34587.1 hypothetical protein CUU95_12570 [Halomonas alkaliphila]
MQKKLNSILRKEDKKLVYCSATHEELVSAVHAIGLETPNKPIPLLSDGNLKFSGWFLPFKQSDRLFLMATYINGDQIVYPPNVSRPDVVKHYLDCHIENDFFGFNYAYPVENLYCISLIINDTKYDIWKVKKNCAFEILEWESKKEIILSKIGKEKAPLKILLKTFNDCFLLERWILHHANIVGFKNLIIADNGSDDQAVLDVYSQYPEINIFKFSGHHNDIHNREKYIALYDCLERTSSRILAIDTDEFLYFYNGKFEKDKKIVKAISSVLTSSMIPSIWIENKEGYEDQFNIGNVKDKLIWGLKWGKPLIPSFYRCNKSLIHNVQFVNSVKWDNLQEGMLVLLHLNKLSSKQRIDANMKKLYRNNVINDIENISDIYNIESSKLENPTLLRFVNEIKDALNKDYNDRYSPELSSGQLKISFDSGSAFFYNKEQRNDFNFFVKNIKSYMTDMV